MQILNGGKCMNNNQIDLGRIYGIKGNISDTSGLEPANMIQSDIIPSLEQIAAYNLASRGIQITPQMNNSSLTTDYPTGVPYDIDFNDNLQTTDQPYVSTPTTALNSSMNQNTMQTNINSVGNTAITDFSNPFPVTAESIQYLNGFIRTQIGRRITVTFLVGSNLLEEKSGFLLGVGANYILINELDTNDLTACDFYNIKFIRFYY